ncbi:MAG: UDP-N-acetylmuramoyl-L-alanine--D-glutamate ligase [Candidatus Gracilibacteria bacterium]|nr:UDP-N-acetylmuramoyl-L-alanine--D-glutamate ligase [Candidatus Gracilibacteria bacterium]
MKINNLNTFKNKKIAILGYGLEGKSTLSFLMKLGVTDITIFDKKNITEKNKDINYITGDLYLENLDQFDLIIKAPGISPYTNNLLKYSEKITTQTEIFTNLYSGKIIGITGTKGKSTISTLLYLSLQNAGYNVKLVGNIGIPVLDEIDIINNEKYDYIVYEMSSYMLEGIEPKLYIGFINNIYNCHLDWHNGMGNYSNAKINIIKKSKHKVVNIETKDFVKNVENIEFFGDSTNYLYSDKKFYIDGIKVLDDKGFLLIGDHNKLNIVGILAILKQIKKDKFCSPWVLSRLINGLKTSLETFKGLPHRLEEVGIYKDILFIDDAIATTPESTIAAIKTYEYKIGTLFLGGFDYGFNFDKLVETIKYYNITNLVLFPESGEKILGDLSNYNYDNEFKFNHNGFEFNLLKTKSMEQAIIFAYKNTEAGKICLLSNASASYGLWSGYIEKGNQFQEFTKKYSLK